MPTRLMSLLGSSSVSGKSTFMNFDNISNIYSRHIKKKGPLRLWNGTIFDEQLEDLFCLNTRELHYFHLSCASIMKFLLVMTVENLDLIPYHCTCFTGYEDEEKWWWGKHSQLVSFQNRFGVSGSWHRLAPACSPSLWRHSPLPSSSVSWIWGALRGTLNVDWAGNSPLDWNWTAPCQV